MSTVTRPIGSSARDRHPLPKRSLFDPSIVRGALVDAVRKLDPRVQARNPVMFVVLVGSVLTTFLFVRDAGSASSERERLHRAGRPVPLVHRAVRQLRRGHGRGPGQGPGRDPAQDPVGDGGPPARARRRDRGDPEQPAAGRRRVRRDRGRGHPRRRRRRRGDRHRRRVGHHRRVGAGDPRVGWRPLGGDGRDPRALRRDRGAHHGPAGRDLPRPHDRPGRRGRAPEDPQRDRPQHPAGRPHDHLPAGRRHPAAVGHLLRGRAGGRRPGRPARLPHPDHHRRPALGHRHRGHGPHGAAQRARHVRPGRRGGGRRQHAAARQDRHHHPRQPPGQRAHPAARRARGRAGQRRPSVEPGRRDA